MSPTDTEQITDRPPTDGPSARALIQATVLAFTVAAEALPVNTSPTTLVSRSKNLPPLQLALNALWESGRAPWVAK